MKKQIILSSIFALNIQANTQMVITALELANELPEKSQQKKDTSITRVTKGQSKSNRINTDEMSARETILQTEAQDMQNMIDLQKRLLQQEEAEIIRQQQIDSLTKENQAQRIQGAYRKHKEKKLEEKIAQDAQLLKQAREAQLLNESNAERLAREAILLARAQEMAEIQNRWNDPDYDMDINESF